MTDAANKRSHGDTSPGGTPDPGTHPAADAAATGKLGAPPGRIGSAAETPPGPEGLTRRDSIAGAAQDAFWRERFAYRSYADADRGYEYYRPAYQAGWEARADHPDRPFDEVEAELRSEWDTDRAGLTWDEARPAVRDAYGRQVNTDASDPGNPLA